MPVVYACDGLATLSKNTTATFFTSSQGVSEIRTSTQVKDMVHVNRPTIHTPLIVYVPVLDVASLIYTQVLLVMLHDKNVIDQVAIDDKAYSVVYALSLFPPATYPLNKPTYSA